MTPLEMLSAPFPPESVSWRIGSSNKKSLQRTTPGAKATKGQALAYLDARDVMDRFDSVVGPDGWQCRYTHVDKKTVCEIDVWVEGRGWVTKADGAGDSDIEAEKGALSDAFKRAAVRWGVGRYLYHIASPWVELDEWERIPDREYAKLRALLTADAKASAPEQPKPLSSVAQAAILGLDLAPTKDEFADYWNKNKDGLKAALEPDEYAKVTLHMKATAGRFAAPSQIERVAA